MAPYDRERSPRRAGRPEYEGIPLVELLLKQGVLDDRAADYLNKAPIGLASEVLLSLGPEVRNPCAYVTSKLKPFLGSAPPLGGKESGKGFAKGYEEKGAKGYGLVEKGGKGGGYGPSAGYGARAAPLQAPRVEAPRLEAPRRPPARQAPANQDYLTQDIFTVHCNGEEISIMWTSQKEVVEELLANKVLDEQSADFFMQAPEHVAREIVSCLQPDVRNPSAFVTRKLKELKRSGGLQTTEAETLMVHFNGEAMPLEWTTKEQAVAELVAAGVLDEGSADFLMKASETVAKDIIGSIGPDVRNPSAFVTRRCKDTVTRSGGGGGGYRGAPVPTVNVFLDGVAHAIDWPSADVAVGQMMQRGILDDRSADFLLKLPERAAWDIVSKIGADVRNPSAFVTKECKKFGGDAKGDGKSHAKSDSRDHGRYHDRDGLR